MKLLLLGGDARVRTALERLIGGAGHHLEWCGYKDQPITALGGYDMIVIMDNPDDPSCLRRVILDIKRQAQHTTILVLSLISAADFLSERENRSCSITRSADGVLHLHCRLSRHAWHEAEAMLLRSFTGQPPTPVVFEYQK